MDKACWLPWSRRQRQRNRGDREMLVPERTERIGRGIWGWGQEQREEFEERVGWSQDVCCTLCRAQHSFSEGLSMIESEWKWDLVHSLATKAGWRLRVKRPWRLGEEDEETGPAGGMGREAAIGTSQDTWVQRGLRAHFRRCGELMASFRGDGRW